MECQNRIWLRRVREKYLLVQYISVPCGRKSCKACAKEMQKAHQKRIEWVMAKYPNYTWMFVTTTGKAWWRKKTPSKPTGNSLELIRHSWSKFRKRLNRKTKKSGLLWMRVYEQHQDGTYHTHAIIGSDSPFFATSGIGEPVMAKTHKTRAKRARKTYATNRRLKQDRRLRWIRTAWFGSGGGYMVHMSVIDFVSGSKSIGYVVKYSIKTGRVIEYSRNFPHFVDAKDPDKITDWEFVGARPNMLEIEWLIADGYTVTGIDGE